MKTRNQIARCIIRSLMLPMLSSCSIEVEPALVAEVSDITFLYDMKDFGKGTRSSLKSPDIEDVITSISIFIYQGDRLIDNRHYESDISDLSFKLEKDETYDVYALANMGDMTSAMPAAKTSIADMTWHIPSYSFVSINGLPMSGKIEGFKAGIDDPVIPLKRLFAKVTAKINLGYDGASVSSVRIKNLNGNLCPFGNSAAESSSSILDEVEFDSGTDEFILYVPENMQGIIGSAEEFHHKNPDLDQEIRAKHDILTYMEVEVTFDGQGNYDGQVIYRSYLGCDSTRDFNLKGNCCYKWEMTCLEGNLQYNDWKTDTEYLSSEIGFSFIFEPEWDEESEIEL